MESLTGTFYSGKYSVLDNFCFAEFLEYYALENKSSKTFEYQPDELMIIWQRITMKSVLSPKKLNSWFQEKQYTVAK